MPHVIRHLLTATLAFALLSACATYTTADDSNSLAAIAAGKHRSAENIARNSSRNPVETLEFFGIRPNMTVVEVSPGGRGWYTEILAPYLKDNGKLYAGSYDPNGSEYAQRNAASYNDKLAANPKAYGAVQVGVFARDNYTAAPVGVADMVLTFRNFHGLYRGNQQAAALAAMYSYLKPGGVLGIVQHRGDPSEPQHPEAKLGYVREDVVIRFAEAAGFVLEAKSEINSNARDTKDHPEGVWNLPPGFRDKEENRAKYAAIGESDRMTLKFRKPATR